MPEGNILRPDMQHPLEAYLTANALTQAEFAGRVECSQAYISRICAGRGTSLQMALRIAEATGGRVPIEALARSVTRVGA